MKVTGVRPRLGVLAVVVGGFAGGIVSSQYITNNADEAQSAGEQEAIVLIDQGVTYLKTTTITYPQWRDKSYPPGVRETTAWGKAFASFDQAKAALIAGPPAPTTTAPTPTPPPVSTLGSALPPLLAASTGPTRSAAPTGSDASDCLASPCRTIQRLENVLLPGETGYVRAGIYTENVVVDVVGTASAPITLRAYPGETVTLHAATAAEIVKVAAATRFFRLQGFTFEATPLLWTGTGRQALWVQGAASGAQDIEISGNTFEGYQAGTTTGHDLTPLLAGPASRRVHLIGNTVRHWGNGSTQRQGIYFQGQDGLIANNVVYKQLHGFGIQVRGESGSVFCNNVIVTGNTVVDVPYLSTAGGRGIMVEDTCRGARVRNNIAAFSISGQQEMYGLDGPSAEPPASSNRAFTNLVWDTGTPNTGNSGSLHVLDFTDGLGVWLALGDNLRADPLFVDRAAGDFRLLAGSPAVSAANPDWVLPFDRDGNPRDAAPDLGAYER